MPVANIGRGADAVQRRPGRLHRRRDGRARPRRGRDRRDRPPLRPRAAHLGEMFEPADRALPGPASPPTGCRPRGRRRGAAVRPDPRALRRHAGGVDPLPEPPGPLRHPPGERAARGESACAARASPSTRRRWSTSSASTRTTRRSRRRAGIRGNHRPSGGREWSAPRAQPSHVRDQAAELQGPAPGGALRPTSTSTPAPTTRTGSTSSSGSSRRRSRCSIYRTRAIEVDNVPASGPVILAANHFSNFDHFLAGAWLRRKIRFLAKSQMFGQNRVLDYIYKYGGVFPDPPRPRRRGGVQDDPRDPRRGGCVMIYCEGGRSRTGELGKAKPGVGRAALETRRPGRPGRDPRLQGIRSWRKLALPEGDDPLRGADQLRRRRDRRPASSSSRRAVEIFAHVREMYEELAARRPRGGHQAGPRRRRRRRTPELLVALRDRLPVLGVVPGRITACG